MATPSIIGGWGQVKHKFGKRRHPLLGVKHKFAYGDLVCMEMGLNTKLGNCDLLYEGFKHKGKRRHPVYGVETNLENGDFCTGGQTQNKLASDDLLYGGSN